MRDSKRAHKGTSLAKGPAWFIGLGLLALGVTGLIFGGRGFTTSAPSGDVTGETWLGIAGNGWTWLLFGAGGLLLLMAAPAHWSAKTMALLVGLALGAASVIALADGTDVLGIAAANGLTKLVLGAVAAALLVIALLPRVGRKRHAAPDDRTTGTVRRDERVVERERSGSGRFDRTAVAGTDGSDRLVGTGGRREVVAPADGDGVEDHGRRRRR